MVVPRDACQPYSVDMCPSASMSYSVYTYYLSFIGLFLNEQGKWACDHNDYCGNAYWGRGGACMAMNCEESVGANRTAFCSKRMTGCSRSCGCALGGEAGRVTVFKASADKPRTAQASRRATADASSEEAAGRGAAANATDQHGSADATDRGSSAPARGKPLLLWLHGYTGEASWATAPGQWGVDKLVDHEGWLVASPEGALDDVGFPYWDSGATFHGLFADTAHSSEQAASDALSASHLDHRSTTPPSLAGAAALAELGTGNLAGLSSQSAYNYDANRDVEHLLNVLDALQAGHDVDPRRVWVGGSANGGLMAYYLACRHSERFAGVLVHGAGQNQRDLDHCRPTTPMHVLHIHGTKDFFPIKSVHKGLGVWADLFGCDATDIYSAPRGQVNAWYNTTVNVFELSACAPGGSVTLWQAEGANHAAVFTDAFPRLLSQHVASREPRPADAPRLAARAREGHNISLVLDEPGGATPAALQPHALGAAAAASVRPPLRRTRHHEPIPANEGYALPF